MPSRQLDEYVRYHGMLVSPRGAARCNASFTGAVLFMPRAAALSAAAAAAESAGASAGRSPFEVSGLSVPTYYALVLLSLTGLSTLLGCTRVLEASEVAREGEVGGSGGSGGSGNASSGAAIVKSARVASVDEEDRILAWTRAYFARRFAPLAAADVCLVRRFRFHFALAGVRVAMQHFVSPGAVPGAPAMLHLAEQYEVDWACFGAAHLVLWLCVAAAAAGVAVAASPKSS